MNSTADIAQAAENGDSKAQLILGWYYYIGHGVISDKSIANNWYQKASANGLPEAKKILEIISTKPEMPSIAEMLNKGKPRNTVWKLFGKAILLTVMLLIVVGLGYYYWPEKQNSAVKPENNITHGNNQLSVAYEEPNSPIIKDDITENMEINSGSSDILPNEQPIITEEQKPITDTQEQEAKDSNNFSEIEPNIPNQNTRLEAERIIEHIKKWLEGTEN